MKRAAGPLLGLIAICSLAGCGGRLPELPDPPLTLNLPECPEPRRPHLPQIHVDRPFDAPENVAALLERDDVMRAYIKGLEAAAGCYRLKMARREPKE